MVVTLTRMLNVFVPVFNSSVNGQISDHGINHLPFFLITPLIIKNRQTEEKAKLLAMGIDLKPHRPSVCLCIACTAY